MIQSAFQKGSSVFLCHPSPVIVGVSVGCWRCSVYLTMEIVRGMCNILSDFPMHMYQYPIPLRVDYIYIYICTYINGSIFPLCFVCRILQRFWWKNGIAG